MGLTINDGVNDLFYEAAQVNSTNKSLLMLGKQIIYCTKVEAYIIAKRLGVKFDYSNLESQWGGVEAYSFFYALGFKEVHAMDISPYEGADIIFDLNNDNLPAEWIGKFDYVIDGGTTEHVFNYAQALFNIAKLLKVGGKVFHYIPACGSWINHGYYCLQPSLLRDFYNSNGFQIERLNIILTAINPPTNSIINCVSTEPDYRIYNLRDIEDVAGYNGILRCIATKTERRDTLTNPKQVHWYGLANGDILQEIWAVDIGLDRDDASIGIFGVDNMAQVFLNIISQHPNFNANKIKAFIVPDNVNLQTFMNYPVIKARDIQNFGINTVFIANMDTNIYNQLMPLTQIGIKVISMAEYRFALTQD